MTGEIPANTAYCLATQYEINGGFVPKMIWVFETDENLIFLRRFIDDFFSLAVGTDLFVKEVPKDSMLYEQEAERLYGTVSVFCGVGTE